MTFLKEEIQCRERSDSYRDQSQFQKPVAQNTPSFEGTSPLEDKVSSSVAALQSVSNGSSSSDTKTGCAVCSYGKRHSTAKCWSMNKLSISDRKEKIKAARLCFRCLQPSHIARYCHATCDKCKSNRHHSLLCEAKSVSNAPVSDSGIVQCCASVTNTESNVQNGAGTVLQTARVFVKGSTGTVRATLLFDSGSDRSYVSSSLTSQLNLSKVAAQPVSYAAFGGGKANGKVTGDVFDLELEGLMGGSTKLRVTEVPVICTPMKRKGVPADLIKCFGPLRFADSYSTDREVTIEILVGLDYYWKFMKVGMVKGPNLVAQETVFGWILSGSWTDTIEPSYENVTLCCLSDVPEDRLQRFWDLDSVGFSDRESGPKDSVLQKFSDTLVYLDEEKRYEVCLPWKDNPGPTDLVSNEAIAKRRLRNLSKYLEAKPVLRQKYNSVLTEMENTGIITEVLPEDKATANPVYYLPHRPVVKESSLTTKVRPVFDASVKGYNGISLNDCMETGPSLFPSIVAILLRFRRWQVGLTSDICKAFLQLKLSPKDQDVHRFFWDDGESVRLMKFLRVPFGNRSSPFLLNATIKAHIAKYPPSLVTQELDENLYMDDWITGADTDTESSELVKQGSVILEDASLSLAKFASNSPVVSNELHSEFGSRHIDADFTKVLGMTWMTSIDCFKFEGIEIPSSIQLTKRMVLSFVARLFDPLGWLNPFVTTLKVLFQKIWKLGLDWDEDLPEELALQFRTWISDLEVLKTWEIPRCYFHGCTWNTLVDENHLEFHMFCDAADQKGYGACVYVRYPSHSGDGSYIVSYVISKARVAPVRSVTLPRLELLSALLGARLLSFVLEALKLTDRVEYRCWTDSTVALAWIQGNPLKLTKFVANRVVEIQKLTNSQYWSHCPGELNPADLLTRGIPAAKLVTSKVWMQGPYFLSHLSLKNMSPDIDSLYRGQFDSDCDISDEVSLVSVTVDSSHPFPFERWSTYGKMVRIVA